MAIDLHVHSTASDGTESPAELMATARAAGLNTIALTDHDTTSGWAEAAAHLPAGMTLVRGAELSCQYETADGSVIALHLLAYLFDAGHPGLVQCLDRMCTDRLTRAEKMVGLMAADGLPVTWAGVTALAAGAVVGRPHLARALVRAEVVPTVDAAFAGPLNSRSPYYLAKADIPVEDAIRLVHDAGGVCVFAHPRRRGRQVSDQGIAALAAKGADGLSGLDGLEVDHPDHDRDAREQLSALADKLGLAVTGSSDYHGTNKRTRIAARTTAPEQFETLIASARGELVRG